MKNQRKNPSEKATNYADEFFQIKQQMQDDLNNQRELINEEGLTLEQQAEQIEQSIWTLNELKKNLIKGNVQ
jgi:hypothetical protein